MGSVLGEGMALLVKIRVCTVGGGEGIRVDGNGGGSWIFRKVRAGAVGGGGMAGG